MFWKRFRPAFLLAIELALSGAIPSISYTLMRNQICILYYYLNASEIHTVHRSYNNRMLYYYILYNITS